MTKSILILNWKDITHPQAGGAEVVIHELAKGLVKEGHDVNFLTSSPSPNSAKYLMIDGIKIIRVGESKFFHSIQATNYYRKNLRNKFDIIIECVNTAPYFVNFFKGNEQVILFYHQLAREIWFYETGFPLNIIGYLLEPIYTFIQSRFKNKVITVSNSSKADLARYGFKTDLIKVITQGVKAQTHPTSLVREAVKSPLDNGDLGGSSFPYILYLGSLRAMKRPIEVLKAMSYIPMIRGTKGVRLIVAGGGPVKEVKKLKKFVKLNGLEDKVEFKGRVDEITKNNLLENAFVLVVPSLKEGWGLVITEAAKLGTPSIVYDVDGLRDSVINNETGFIVENKNAEMIAEKIQYLIENPVEYQRMCETCIENSKTNTFENSYTDFKAILGL